MNHTKIYQTDLDSSRREPSVHGLGSVIALSIHPGIIFSCAFTGGTIQLYICTSKHEKYRKLRVFNTCVIDSTRIHDEMAWHPSIRERNGLFSEQSVVFLTVRQAENALRWRQDTTYSTPKHNSFMTCQRTLNDEHDS